MNARVYFDATRDPQNPGWVCETETEGKPQFALDATDPAAPESDLIAEARAFADGEITVDRERAEYYIGMQAEQAEAAEANAFTNDDE